MKSLNFKFSTLAIVAIMAAMNVSWTTLWTDFRQNLPGDVPAPTYQDSGNCAASISADIETVYRCYPANAGARISGMDSIALTTYAERSQTNICLNDNGANEIRITAKTPVSKVPEIRREGPGLPKIATTVMADGRVKTFDAAGKQVGDDPLDTRTMAQMIYNVKQGGDGPEGMSGEQLVADARKKRNVLSESVKNVEIKVEDGVTTHIILFSKMDYNMLEDQALNAAGQEISKSQFFYDTCVRGRKLESTRITSQQISPYSGVALITELQIIYHNYQSSGI